MTEDNRTHVLIAGVTTRALAISAARAGHRVTAVDAYGDLDLRAAAEVIALRSKGGRRYSAEAAAGAANAVPAQVVAYTSNFENYPAAVASLARHRSLLGNPPEVLRRVRNPMALERSLRRLEFAGPRVRSSPPGDSAPVRWLLKPRRSGGGHGITVWRRRQPVPKTSYLQERITGLPGSIAFAADGRNAVPLGLALQLVGDRRFGAAGFRYCGSILAPSSLFPQQEKLFDMAAALAAALTAEFGLIGLNGIDFIARDGIPYPVEVNPRVSASMELIERARGISLFRMHEEACQGSLPPAMSSGPTVEGKGIVFARRDVCLGDTRPWFDNHWLADIPHSGEQIRRGHPVCTVLASARDVRACQRLLLQRADLIYGTLKSSTQGVA